MDYGLASKEKNKAYTLKQTQWWKNQKAKGQCHYCKRRTAPSELTMDHKVPISRNGKSVRKNVVPCCRDCNRQKKYLTAEEWAYHLEKIMAEKNTVD